MIISIVGFFTQTVNAASPTVSNPNPNNKAMRVSTYKTTLTIALADPDGDTIDWTIESRVGNSSATGASNGTKVCTISNLGYETTYYWYVNVTDGATWTRASYQFTTLKSTDIDIDELLANVPEFFAKAYKIQLGDIFWPFIFLAIIGSVWASTTNIGVTLASLLLTFALFGTTKSFMAIGAFNIFSAIIASACVAGLILALFMKSRR